MEYLLIIPGRLDNLNDYIRALDSSRYKGSGLKKKNETICKVAIYEQLGRLRIKKPVTIKYKWFEKDTKRDLDNISSFGRKVIQDALVSCKILPDDGWKQIKGFRDDFFIDPKNPRIEILIQEEGG